MKMKFTLLLLLVIMAMPLSAQTVGATDNEPVYNMNSSRSSREEQQLCINGLLIM